MDEPNSDPGDRIEPKFKTLKDLINFVTGIKPGVSPSPNENSGIADQMPFPFLGIVGQREMKLALLLGLINPNIGGILLIGPRGTGKTTAVRSLLDLLPWEQRSNCYYGCLPEDIEINGMDAVCPECARKYGMGESLTSLDKVRLVELPLNAGIDDVVGGREEEPGMDRYKLKKGILSQADKNILYIDEVNLLNPPIVDVILDAAAQGYYTVRRGFHSASYNSRFVLIGSMNPEEGFLRPQILDRFGLRVLVKGLDDPEERLVAYQLNQQYANDPRRFINQFVSQTTQAQLEIEKARRLLKQTSISAEIAEQGIRIIRSLKIDSLRAEISLFETARALAASDDRTQVTIEDIRSVASMALRMRRSKFMDDYFIQQELEEKEVLKTLD